jgi:hypothetical protein
MIDEDKMFHISNQMDRESLAAFERNVPTSVCRAIANDHVGKPTSFPATPSETPGKTNWVEPNPIEPPAGVAICDAMMAQQDRRWRRELAKELGVKAPNDEPPSAA